MFEIGKKYWFVQEGSNGQQLTVKGEVIDENSHLVKVKRDTGDEVLIVLKRLLSVNTAKD